MNGRTRNICQTQRGAGPSGRCSRPPPVGSPGGRWRGDYGHWPPSLSAQAFATCLPVSMPTEKGNKHLTAGTPPARLERGHSTSLRRAHVWARQGTGAPSGRHSLGAFGIYLGGLGRGRYPIHGSGMRNRRPGLAHVCRSEQSHSRILGKEVGVPSPEVRLIFVAVGWLVCALQFPNPRARWRLEAQRRGSRV